MIKGASNTPKIKPTLTEAVRGTSSTPSEKIKNSPLSKLSQGYTNQSAGNQEGSPVLQPRTTIKLAAIKTLPGLQADKNGPA
jgi:hypothetical protein